MMNLRHLTLDEKRIVRELVNDTGVVELLRLLATIVGNDHPDLFRGNRHKTDLLLLANSIDRDRATLEDWKG